MPCLWSVVKRLFDIDTAKVPPSLVIVTLRSRENPKTGFRLYSIGVGDGLKGYVLTYFDETRKTEEALGMAYYPSDAIVEAARDYSERYPQLKLLWVCDYKISDIVLRLNGERGGKKEEEKSEGEEEESKQAVPVAKSGVVELVGGEVPLEPVFANIADIVKDEEERLWQDEVEYEVRKGLTMGFLTAFLLGIDALAKILKAIKGWKNQ